MKQVAYITDIHLDDSFPIDAGVDPRKNWQTILADVRKRNITDIILGGDMGEPVSLEWFFDSLKGFTINMSLGNHDKFQEIVKYCSKHSEGTDELYYSLEEGDFKYIFMDSSSNRISDPQFHWLLYEMITDKQILLFIHHPLLEVDTQVDKLYPLLNRDQVRSALRDIPSNITVFAGHYHMNDEKKMGNLRQHVTHAASVQLVKDAPFIETDNSTFGYRILTINEDNIETELVTFT